MQRVVRSSIIDAPIERVWAILRDFNSHIDWHPVVAESAIEGGEPPDRVGCVRRFVLDNGARLREQLLSLSDSEHRLTYCILESEVPLERYVATVQLRPVTDGTATFWHWESTFGTPPGRERELADMVGNGVYEGGFAGMRRYLARGRAGGGTKPVAGETLGTDAIVVERPGGPEVLALRRLEVAPPGPGEARVRHAAIGVNYFDVQVRSGLHGGVASGSVLGVEASGVVIDIGPGVTQVMPGDRVAYASYPPGSYCGVRNLPAAHLVRIPDAVSNEVAAAGLLKGLTAEYLLFRLHRLEPGTVVLVHSAAGGLGSIVTQWAAHLGAVVIGTVSNREKAHDARAHGCAHVVVTSDYRFADAVLAATDGRGADLVIDGLGNAAVDENLAALARFGHWISVGNTSGPIATVLVAALSEKSGTFSRPVLFHYTADPPRLAAMAARLWAVVAAGAVRPVIGETFALGAAAEAHRRLEARATRGSLLLVP